MSAAIRHTSSSDSNAYPIARNGSTTSLRTSAGRSGPIRVSAPPCATGVLGESWKRCTWWRPAKTGLKRRSDASIRLFSRCNVRNWPTPGSPCFASAVRNMSASSSSRSNRLASSRISQSRMNRTTRSGPALGGQVSGRTPSSFSGRISAFHNSSVLRASPIDSDFRSRYSATRCRCRFGPGGSVKSFSMRRSSADLPNCRPP
ncbi:hypothetical protein EF879_08405 [Micromonospora sp. HM5-17]|nr:hypothetical protein EF879_08405 [Micromonospora sp. HM5-17]